MIEFFLQCIASTNPAVFQSKQCYEFLLLFIKHNDSKVGKLMAIQNFMQKCKKFCKVYFGTTNEM